MRTKKALHIIDYVQEFFFCMLLYAITFSNAAVESSIGFVAFFFLIKCALGRMNPVRPTPLNKWIYVYAALILITCFRSGAPHESWRGLWRVPKYMILFFASIEFFSNKERRMGRIFWVIIGISCFTYFNALFQNIFGFDILRHREFTANEWPQRVMASFVHPNDFGAYLISVLPLSLVALFPGMTRKRKIFLICVGLVSAYWLIRTASRGAWLGLVVGLFVYFFVYKKKIALLIPFIAIVGILCFPHARGRVFDLFSGEKNTVWERTQLWKGTWNMVKEHPILGFGVNTYSHYFPQYKPVDYPDIRYAHNSYLQMWSEIGILGLLAFLSIIATVFVKACRGLKKKVASGFHGYILLSLLSGYVAFLVQSGLDTNLYSLVFVTQFWIITAFILSLNQLIEARICKKTIQ